MRRHTVSVGLVAACVAASVAVLCAGCAASNGWGAAAVNRVVDDWHKAAAAADKSRYFKHMSRDSVFIGTDAGERWSKAAFLQYAAPHFDRGKAWDMRPKGRHVVIAPGGKIAWFDELLEHTKYGKVRGSGVLQWRDGKWLIAHYVLSFPVPNDVANQVIAVIKGAKSH